jgi:hypothetical protein
MLIYVIETYHKKHKSNGTKTSRIRDSSGEDGVWYEHEPLYQPPPPPPGQLYYPLPSDRKEDTQTDQKLHHNQEP